MGFSPFYQPPGASDFTQLSDVPSSYAGQTGLFLRVNATETGLEFAAGGGGGGDLQDAYDAGNNILLNASYPVEVRDSGATFGTQPFIGAIWDFETKLGNVFNGMSPFVHTATRVSDTAITSAGGGSTDIDFGAGVDLISSDVPVPGVNSTVSQSLVFIKSADVPADVGVYIIVAVSNGAGTNSVATLFDVTGSPASLTMTSGTAKVMCLLGQVTNEAETSTACVGVSTSYLSTLQSDGGSISELLRLKSTSLGGVSSSFLGIDNEDTSFSGSYITINSNGSDGTGIYFQMGSDTGPDVIFSSRTADPTTNVIGGALAYRSDTGRIRFYEGVGWEDIAYLSDIGGGGAPANAQYVTLATDVTLTDERVLTGTANQITITDNGAGSTVVLSTPQNIHTAANVQFATATLTGSNPLALGTASTNNGGFILYNGTNANTVTIQSGTTSASYTLTLPTAQATGTQVLQNNGSGVLSWATISGGGETLAQTLAIGASTGANDIVISDTQAIKTDTGIGDTALIQAYDVDGAAYVTFATLTAGNTPTFDLNAATTVGGSETITTASSLDNFTNKTGNISQWTNDSGYLTSVAVSDLDNGTAGELITWDAAGVADTVATGTSGQVLTSNGAGAAPTFQTVSSASTFADNVFRVFDNGDNTKEFAVEVSNVTASTTRTFTVPDEDGIFTTLPNASSLATGNTSYSIIGLRNTIYGVGSGTALTIGTDNVLSGYLAGTANIDGIQNTVTGTQAGRLGTSYDNCSIYGERAGTNNTADGNSFFGRLSGNANTSGTGLAFFGNSAGAASTGDNNSFFGEQAGVAVTTGNNLTLFGHLSGATLTTALRNTFVGAESDAINNSIDDSIVLGYQSLTTDNNQFVAGSTASPINNVYFGNGAVNTSASNYAINGVGGSGTNNPGGDLTIAAGKGTGNAVGGSLFIATPAQGSSGSTLQSLNNTVEFNYQQQVLITGQLQLEKGPDRASASTTTLSTYGNYFDITGTTTINYITTTDWKAGSMVVLQFDSAVTITDNAGTPPANTADILLAGTANMSATAGSTLTLLYDGTFWRETARMIR